MTKVLIHVAALALVLEQISSLATALSQEIVNREFIELTNPVNTRVQQSLPVSFVRDWSTWVLEEDGKLCKIPDGDDDDDGFVQPASIDEVWQPVDLKRPEMKLALGLHVREGIIRHLMPAVDLSFNGGEHRNRGMCSVPRAHSWIEFSLSIDEWENYKIILSSKDKKKKKKKKQGDEDDDGGGEEEEEWNQLLSSSPGSISKAIERAMICLSTTAPDDLGVGSHIVNVVLDEDVVVECPKNELRALMDDDDFVDNPDEASGVLQVVISPSMAGSESDYMPDAYRPLYNNESLRNPLYAKFKQRQQDREDLKNKE